jgi:hypothetical protein
MYGQQKLLRIKNHIDTYKLSCCAKCGKQERTDYNLTYAKGDVQPIRDYYKKINFMSVKFFVETKEICQINILDNKVDILHSEYFRQENFAYDDNIYLLPFLKLLHTYKRNAFPTTLRKILIQNYNQFLIKVVQSTSDSTNATYGKYISNYSPSEKLKKLFQKSTPMLVGTETKEFLSEKFYNEFEGKQLDITVSDNSQDIFFTPYTTEDKDKHLVWLMVNDFTNWYIDNHQNYKFLCANCYGKLEYKRSRKIPEILDNTFDNKKFLELKKQYQDSQTQRLKDEKEARLLDIKENRPALYKSQYGTIETEKAKKNNK